MNRQMRQYICKRTRTDIYIYIFMNCGDMLKSSQFMSFFQQPSSIYASFAMSRMLNSWGSLPWDEAGQGVAAGPGITRPQKGRWRDDEWAFFLDKWTATPPEPITTFDFSLWSMNPYDQRKITSWEGLIESLSYTGYRVSHAGWFLWVGYISYQAY